MRTPTKTATSTSTPTSTATKRSPTKGKALTTPSAAGLKRFSTGLQARIRSVGYVSPQCAMAAVTCAGNVFEPLIKSHAHAVEAITGTSSMGNTAAATSKNTNKRVQNQDISDSTPPINTSSPSKFCKAKLSSAPRKKHSWISKTFGTPLESFFDTVTSPW